MSQLTRKRFVRDEASRGAARDLSGADRAERRLLRAVVIVTLLAAVAITITEGLVGGRTNIFWAMLPIDLFLAFSLVLLGRGILWPARLLTTITMFVVLTYLIAVGGGIHDVAMLAYAAVLILSSLTLGRNAPIAFGAATIVAVTVIGVLEIQGIMINEGSFITTPSEIVLISILVMAIVGLQRLMVAQSSASLRRAQESEQAQVRANQDLRELQAALESRVQERTRELARRSSYLEATAEIAREAASTLDLPVLLASVVVLVSERLGFYHAGLFLVSAGSEGGEWAELKAASSAEGQQMLARGHRLPVDDRSLVGHVIRHGLARVAGDTAVDEIYYRNPDLTETRSEMALPLRARGEILGALDVQSTLPRAFGDEDVTSLHTLADQVALAISNARLFEQAQTRLEAEQRAYGQWSRQSWQILTRSRRGWAYRSRQGMASVVKPSAEPIPRHEPEVAYLEDLPALDVPIRVRGRVVATIQARKHASSGAWTADESDLVASLAEQLGVALDSARLYEDARRREVRERLIGQVTGRIRTSLDLDAVLDTAVREISDALDLAAFEVQLGFSSEGNGARRSTRAGESAHD